MFLNLQLQKIAPDYFTNGLPSLETGNMPPPPSLFPLLTTLTSIPPFRHPSILSSSLLQHATASTSGPLPDPAKCCSFLF